jgi:raffinose/stachyose/melibiose transport system permease protein
MRIGTLEKSVDYIVLSVFALFALIPLVGVVFSSVIPAAENSGGFQVPGSVRLANYADAWAQGHFSAYLTSSVLVTVAVVIATIVLAILAGYAFARMDFPGSGTLFFILLVGLMLPEEAFIIPLYFNLRTVGMTDTYWALILPQTAQSLGFAAFWMRNHFRAYPGEVIEAARLDGASDRRLLWRVLVPSSWPSIATMAVLVGMWTWNEFLIPLVMITQDQLRTAPLGLAFFQGQHMTNYSLLSAAGVLIALPIVVLYLFMQRRVINGVAGGIGTR